MKQFIGDILKDLYYVFMVYLMKISADNGRH